MTFFCNRLYHSIYSISYVPRLFRAPRERKRHSRPAHESIARVVLEPIPWFEDLFAILQPLPCFYESSPDQKFTGYINLV